MRLAPVLGVARGAWPVVGSFALGAAGLWAAALSFLGLWGVLAGVPATLVALWCIWFFRDPERRPPGDRGVVISAADGVVCAVGPAAPPSELHIGAASAMRISVFMNIFNVHVNRAPVRGRVAAVNYRPGRFFNASLDKASEYNERCAVTLDLGDGRRVGVVQIAGLVARRIVCGVKAGDELRVGERFGLIRFGSRVDVFLPDGFESRVKVGERVRAGESVIARAAVSEPQS